MKELKIEEKIAQMFLIELQEKDITQETIEMIKKYKIGGVVLFRRNYDSYDEMINLVNKLKELNRENDIPLFISLDQEGGRVNRMPFELKNLKSAGTFAKTKNIEIVKESANLISEMLNGMGVNLNYAPVLDIRRFEDDNHAIGNRCYGFNKEDVSKYGIVAMKQMQENKIIPAVKHFPGHGATMKDSHFTLPIVDKTKEDLENDDMVPFKNAIDEGAAAIMVGHIIIKDIDNKHPASLSKKIIQSYLIDKYKYKGLIITDDLKMLAIRLKYSQKKAVELAIEAGNDMIILGCKYKEIIKIIKYIAGNIKSGKINANRVEQSVNKIITMKEKYNVNDNEIKGLNIEEINKKIEELNNKVEI